VTKHVGIKKVLRYAVAIVASICLVGAVLKTYQFMQLSADALYNEAYVDYQLPHIDTSSSKSNLGIDNLFRKKDFKAIIRESKKTYLPNDKTFLLIGMSHLHTNDPFKAIAAFKQIKPSGNYSQQAQYYLSLAYLKNNDYDQALGLIEQIKNNKTHLYHQHFSSSYLNKIQMLKWK